MNIEAVLHAIRAMPTFEESDAVQLMACIRERLPAGNAELAILQAEDGIAADIEAHKMTEDADRWLADQQRLRARVEAYGVHSWIMQEAS